MAERPVTSKARGVCKYYNHPRGCWAGNNCKFLHGEAVDSPDALPLLTSYDTSKKCRFYAQGFCKHGEKCWFRHVVDSSEKGKGVADVKEVDEELCSICFEKPAIYGLLSGCSHIFCIACIRKWRDPANQNSDIGYPSNTKKCPMCRTTSRFITPSSIFWKEGNEEKENAIKAYKASMAKIPCRYFQQTKHKDSPFCKFGKDCFYQHMKDDGTPYIFDGGANVYMAKNRRPNLRRNRSGSGFAPFELMFTNFGHFEGDGIDFVINHFDFGVPWRPRGQAVDLGGSSQPGTSNEETTQSVLRRINGIGQSLERLNEAIYEDTTFDGLNAAVNIFRDGFGSADGGQRPEGTGSTRRRERSRNAQSSGTGAPDDSSSLNQGSDAEDGGIHRLEELVHELLTTLTTQDSENTVVPNQSNTPSPPVEPVLAESIRPEDDWFRTWVGWSDNNETPGPASISPPNESGNDSDSSNDPVNLSPSSMNDSWPQLRMGVPVPNVFGTPPPPPRVALPRVSGRFSTTVDRRTEPDMVLNIEQDNGDSHEEVPAVENNVRHPPFVTDGRGRVIWTCPGEQKQLLE